MAGDWIKIDANLHEKPEVLSIARDALMNRFEVVGRLHRVWSWFDAHSDDGHAPSVTLVTLDEVVSCDGFAQAMEKVGWLHETDAGVSLPNFDRHNGNSAKSRAQATRRKQASRSDRDKRHAPTVTKTGLEKRREEYKSAPRSKGESESAAPGRIPEDLRPDVPQGTRETLDAIAERIKKLLLFENLRTLDDLKDQDWQIIQDYLNARLPEGSGGWQPNIRRKFIETAVDVWTRAEAWHRKRKRSGPKVVPDRPAPAPQSAEEAAEAAEALKALMATTRGRTHNENQEPAKQ
jgi:hypothetical protein